MKRMAALAAGMILAMAPLWSAGAENAFPSYVYDTQGDAVGAPAAVYLDRTVTGTETGTSPFSSPGEVMYAENGHLYVADTGNSRVVQLDGQLRCVRVYEGATAEGESIGFSLPKGIFVRDGLLYVCDTGNHRVVVMDGEGRLVRLIGTPDSPLFQSDFVFNPRRILVDAYGRIFVISEGFNQGVIQLDRDGGFVSFYGAAKVTVSMTEYFWRLISTKAQVDRTYAFVPTEYNGMTVDSSNFIYVTTNAYSQNDYQAGKITPLRKLNAEGNDILVTGGTVRPYGDTAFVQTGSYRGASSLVDVCALPYGVYAVLDSNRGRFFVYNAGGELLFEGGGPGQVNGLFQVPVSMTYGDGALYILDSSKATLTRYALNDYGRQLLLAAEYHEKNQYDAEEAVWQSVLQKNRFSRIALTGLGKAEYRRQNYEQAMEYFRRAEDTANYSKAFRKYRMLCIEAGFAPFMAVLVCGIAALVLLRRLWKRKVPQPQPGSFRAQLGYARHTAVHPFDGFWDLRREGKGSLAAALTWLSLASVAIAVYARYCGFIFRTTRPEEVNVLLELLKLWAPVLLFCVCNWCVTSLMEGEGPFRDIVMAAGYASFPLVLLFPIATLLSRILTQDEGDIYRVLLTVALLWMLALLVCANRQIHNYSMSKSVAVLGITVAVMAFVVFLLILVFAFAGQIAAFVSDIYTEISLRM